MKPSPDYFVVLDDAQTHTCRHYQDFCRVDAIAAADIQHLDARLQQGWQQHLHVVLWMPYDFGSELMFGGDTEAMYLLWFKQCAVVADQHPALPWQSIPAAPAGIAALHNTVTQADYLAHIDAIHAAITRGDVYQINYTTAWTGAAYGSPSHLYARLRERQQVPYGVLAHLPPEVNGGAAWHLGFSPELFLAIETNGTIRTKPMKGTAPILGDGLDAERAEALRHDAKNRAENVMIVDLLRNDLGKLAIAGGVTVPQAFDVQAFGSVWQMTSTVTARMRPETTVADIIQAAFPCGSITGAPKRMAMQVIADLEQRQRGMYTGSIGFLEPCASGLGWHGTWNVVIRSLQLTERSAQCYDANMGIGSGIVIDSVGMDEWEECLWKARFVRGLPSTVGLIETLCIDEGECALLPWHQQRLQRSLQDLQIVCDVVAVWQALQDACASECAQGLWRMKLEVMADGSWQWHCAALDELAQPVRLEFADWALPDADVLRRYKTNHRALLDATWQAAGERGCFDGLLFNQSGYLLEGGRCNVFVRHQGRWLTPALQLDVLNGVMRQAIMERPEYHGFVGGVTESARISREMVQDATDILVSNALRGVVQAQLVVEI